MGYCSLKDVREKYFMWSSLKELFENVDATTVVILSKKSIFIILFNDLCYCFHITLAVGACFYLAFYIIRFYHLLYAIAYKLTIISFSQHPT